MQAALACQFIHAPGRKRAVILPDHRDSAALQSCIITAMLDLYSEVQPAMKLLLLTFATLFVTIPLASAETPSIQVVPKQHIDFLVGGQLVGRYVIDDAVAKPHFHPLNGPTGKPVTRGYPMIKDNPDEAKDHPHQRAAWFCHGDVIPEGLTLTQRIKGVEGVDFWSESPGHGRIVCAEVGMPKSDGNHAWIDTRNEWRTADGQKILDETRVLHVYDLGDAKLLTFDINLHASVVPITFGDTKEGSFAVRVAEFMTEKRKLGGALENAEGMVAEANCWGRKSAWCDYSGPVEGAVVGVTILDDPKNPHPAHWHARGYGLMGANPFGRSKAGFPDARGRTDLVKLAKGDHLKLRYGILLHRGDAKTGKVAERYAEFVRLR